MSDDTEGWIAPLLGLVVTVVFVVAFLWRPWNDLRYLFDWNLATGVGVAGFFILIHMAYKNPKPSKGEWAFALFVTLALISYGIHLRETAENRYRKATGNFYCDVHDCE